MKRKANSMLMKGCPITHRTAFFCCRELEEGWLRLHKEFEELCRMIDESKKREALS